MTGVRSNRPIVSHISPRGRKESSPRREPWERGMADGRAPEGRKNRWMSRASYAPPGLLDARGESSHGLRRGLLSFAPPGLALCHSERSEESLVFRARDERFFAALRMTSGGSAASRPVGGP